MMGLNFGGGFEFVVIYLWMLLLYIVLIVVMLFFVNLCYILMGVVFELYIWCLLCCCVFVVLFFMCDESWVMLFVDVCECLVMYISVFYYVGICMGFYLMWILMMMFGVVVGLMIGNVE